MIIKSIKKKLPKLPKPPYVIGIIGGKGNMGQLFKKLFEKKGHKTLIASRSTSLSMKECAKKSDILILSVPISGCERVIKDLAPLVGKHGLLMDLISIKQKPFELMKQHAHCQVIGAHPVFGPHLKTLKNQVVVLCPSEKNSPWLSFITTFLKKEGALVTLSTPLFHDQMMSVVQGLIHFTAINLIGTLASLGIDQNQIKTFSSPLYKIQIDLATRILAQDPSLYASISMKNKFVGPVLKEYLRVQKKLFRSIHQKNEKQFIQTFEQAADYLAHTKTPALKRIDKLIEFLSCLK